jgi:hypothetical protein
VSRSSRRDRADSDVSLDDLPIDNSPVDSEEEDEHTDRLVASSSKLRQSAPGSAVKNSSAAKKRVAQEALMDTGEDDDQVEPDNSDYIDEAPS